MKKNNTKNAGNVRLIVLDVDGVLTDGGIIIGSDGTEFKKFNVKDGGGIAIARAAGIKIAVISARRSKVIAIRCKELKIDSVYQGVHNKRKAYAELKKKYRLKDENICFMGDEIIDLPVLERCGFSAAPADAVAEVTGCVDYVSRKKGGEGCVREVIEIILKKKKLWKKAVAGYLKDEK